MNTYKIYHEKEAHCLFLRPLFNSTLSPRLYPDSPPHLREVVVRKPPPRTCCDLYVDVTVNSLTWETPKLRQTTDAVGGTAPNAPSPPLPPRKPKPILQNISLFAKQHLFAPLLKSLAQVLGGELGRFAGRGGREGREREKKNQKRRQKSAPNYKINFYKVDSNDQET